MPTDMANPAIAKLPISDALPRLLEALAASSNAVLVAPPGAGKTTAVPLALLAARWCAGQRILMLEPRRLAARAAATRMATLLGEAPGATVGFRTRLESAISRTTRIEVITEGLLIRRLMDDPGLDGVAAVIFDEVHERSLDGDLALALCLDLQRVLRPDIRLVAMSATADVEGLAPVLGASVVTSAGRMFPVTVEYAARDLSDPGELPEIVARAVRGALVAHPGDILAFLPGVSEITRAGELLAFSSVTVLPLHGELGSAEQDRVLRPAPGRRVVLATSIAETSLTVPGVRIVVDGGWRRRPTLDTSSGLTRLSTLRVSRATADQRAGRAGRITSGVAIRLWTEALHRGLPQFDRPEILEAELSGLALSCHAWGTSPEALSFPTAPPAGAVAAANGLLAELGLLSDSGHLTEAGQQVVRLGSHPRLGAMVVAARDDGERALAAELISLLEDRDPLRSAPSCDIELRLWAMRGGAGDAERAALSRIRQIVGRYRARLRLQPHQRADGDPGRLIAAGFPDRIAQSRGGRGSFRLAGGGSAILPDGDGLAANPLLAVAALDIGRDGVARVRLAAPLSMTALPPAVTGRLTSGTETHFEPSSGAVTARERLRYGNIVLADRQVPAAPELVANALATVLDLHDLPWTDTARQFQARVHWMRTIEPEEMWPDLSDQRLHADRTWLVPHLLRCHRKSDAERLDLTTVLRSQLSDHLLWRVDKALPLMLELMHGRVRVKYTEPIPVAEARAQVFFGSAVSPKLADGRVPVRFALLSPAGRPIAITSDLQTFWQSGWSDVRKDMRGRYPKHDWPENPAETRVRRP